MISKEEIVKAFLSGDTNRDRTIPVQKSVYAVRQREGATYLEVDAVPVAVRDTQDQVTLYRPSIYSYPMPDSAKPVLAALKKALRADGHGLSFSDSI